MTPGNFPLTLYRGATFGPVIITAKNAAQEVVDLTGWTPHAEVRLSAGKPVILDLNPTIPNPTDGKVVFGFTDEETKLVPHGNYVWDLLLERPTGEILGPFLSGAFVVKSVVTQA